MISQFTLHASTKKGNRPSYIKAARPEVAIPLYEYFIEELMVKSESKVATGVFGADMKVALINDGPVTILIDSKKTGFSRENLRLAFEKDNIEARPLWKPMHLQPVFEKYPYYGNNVAETLFENGLCLPSGSNLTDSDRERIAAVIKSVFVNC